MSAKQPSHIQLGITLDYEHPSSKEALSDEVSQVARKHVVIMLRKLADDIMKGGTPVECGCSHCHEDGTLCDEDGTEVGNWSLQVD